MIGEIRALTTMRGLAAWMVVLYHVRLAIDGLPDWGLSFLAQGYLAVDFFFLLSGFVIWMSAVDKLQAGGLRAIPAFLQRRIARIWPLHVAMLCFGIALALLLVVTGRSAAHFPFEELPLHFLLIQNWGFTERLAWNDPAWSISTEFAAYLLFPLIALSVDWRRLPTSFLLATLAGLFLLLHVFFTAQGLTSLGQNIPRTGLLRCVLEFCAGTILAALWLRWRDRASRVTVISFAISALAATLSIMGLVPQTFGVPICFAALLLALATLPRTILDSRPLHYLGDISYATYLSHYLLWFAFKLVFVDETHRIGPAQLALYLEMVLAASMILYHGVERPAQRWINRLSFRRRPITEPA